MKENMEGENHSYGNRDDNLGHLECVKTYRGVFLFESKKIGIVK